MVSGQLSFGVVCYAIMRQLGKLLPDQDLLTKVRTMLPSPLFSLENCCIMSCLLTKLSSDFRY